MDAGEASVLKLELGPVVLVANSLARPDDEEEAYISKQSPGP